MELTMRGNAMLARSTILLSAFLMIVFGTVSTNAAEDTLTTLNVKSIKDIRGRHSHDQSTDVLNTKVMSGEADDWNQYIEFSPSRRKGYRGSFTFRLPSHISPEMVKNITLNINFQGPEKSEQRWSWRIRNFEKHRNVFLGDNRTAKDWNWTSMSFKTTAKSYIGSDGRIKIRLSSNNAYDVCNLDYLQVRIQTAADSPNDDKPVDDQPTDDDAKDDIPILQNQAPSVEAGVDQTITWPEDTVLLSADVRDDGLPNGSPPEVNWDMTSGPADAVIVSSKQPQTEVDFTAPGDYEFEVSATDGELTTSDSVGVTIKEAQNQTDPTDNDFKDIALRSSVTHVQPMTGIVFWADSGRNNTDSIQLEYAYMPFNRVVENKNQYNWNYVDQLLNQIAARGHQAVLRFYYVYPGKKTTVPAYIKNSAGYNETTGKSEGQTTDFPDWSSEELKTFTLDFYSQLAARYDNDARMAYLQVGFGLWGEYHIYDGPMVLGKTFPSKAFQAAFMQHLDHVFNALPWSISIDAAETEVGPFGENPSLKSLAFGLLDDSFLHKNHHQYNAACFNFFEYENRFHHSPMGGELSYYSDYDQQHALDPQGPYGIPFETMASSYHISYMIGNDQPDYQSMSRIAAAGMATGYKFQITSFKASSSQSRVTVKNRGIAPIYYDAFVTVNQVRSQSSLKGLLPGQSKEFTVNAGGDAPELSLECDRLVPGQAIEFDADL
jgi:hypothetical protein